MKKILILGGAANQLPLISHAKKEGYYVVVCDWTNTNPGIALADKHYQVSTLDRKAVLNVARQERVDGVISNSEPAMANVAYISQELGLMGNPLTSIELLNSKDHFRTFQERIGVYAPKHLASGCFEELWEYAKTMRLPFMIKPAECSATRGTVKVDVLDKGNLKVLFDNAKEFAYNGIVSVEEYVEMPDLHILDGDVFVCNGEIIWDGMFLSSRSSFAPMVPMTQSYPLVLDKIRMDTVKSVLTKIFTEAGVVFGEYNVEMYFTKEDELFVIEINARQGGNAIPIMIQQHCGVNMYKLLVTTCVGDMDYFDEVRSMRKDYHYVSRMPVFSKADGKYKGLSIASVVQPYVTAVEYRKQDGDKVERCKNASDVVAFVNLCFDSYETQKTICEMLEDSIVPVLY